MKSTFVFALLILILVATAGCPVTPGGAPGTTQPVATLDPQTVKFFTNLAIGDTQFLLASGLLKVSPGELAAAQKALADLQNADPTAPGYQKYVQAVNDAGITLLAANAKAKAGTK